jgi:hypothetical protein
LALISRLSWRHRDENASGSALPARAKFDDAGGVGRGLLKKHVVLRRVVDGQVGFGLCRTAAGSFTQPLVMAVSLRC